MKVPTFILASGSERRRQLLEDAGYSFVTIVSNVEEPAPAGFATPESYAVHTAWLKAHALPNTETRWILAADTITTIAARILGKPVDRADAERILRTLMGTRHEVWTGVCLRLPTLGFALTAGVQTHVTMRALSDRELAGYLDSGWWEGKAGAYGIQNDHDPFVESIEGSYSNVVGLPMGTVEDLLGHALVLTGS